MRRTTSFQSGTGYLVVAGFLDVTCNQVWPLNTLPVSLPLIECRVIRATWVLQHMRYITSERDYPLNSVIQLSSPSTHNALCWSKHYRQGFWPIQVVEMLIHKPATLRWGSTIFHNPLRADSGLATLQVYLWGDRKTRQDTNSRSRDVSFLFQTILQYVWTLWTTVEAPVQLSPLALLACPFSSCDGCLLTRSFPHLPLPYLP